MAQDGGKDSAGVLISATGSSGTIHLARVAAGEQTKAWKPETLCRKCTFGNAGRRPSTWRLADY